MLDRVLIVCVGNICRSPMAEALLRARFAERAAGKRADQRNNNQAHSN